jgi:hypothetical protein
MAATPLLVIDNLNINAVQPDAGDLFRNLRMSAKRGNNSYRGLSECANILRCG